VSAKQPRVLALFQRDVWRRGKRGGSARRAALSRERASSPQVRALSLVPSPLFPFVARCRGHSALVTGGSRSAGRSRRLFTEQAFFRPHAGSLARGFGNWTAGDCRDVQHAWSCASFERWHAMWRGAFPPRRFFIQSASPFTLSKTECSKQVKRGRVKNGRGMPCMLQHGMMEQDQLGHAQIFSRFSGVSKNSKPNG